MMISVMRILCLSQLLFLLVWGAKTPVATKKSKLCGNDKCDEVLFTAKVKRTMGSNHEAFLSLAEGDQISVTAVKFSDRTDLMEGALASGAKGNFYTTAIDIGSYVEFLRNAINTKKELKEVSQDPNDRGAAKLLGTIRADQHLKRDYNVQAVRYAQEQNLPEPELLPLDDLDSHSGHGHSHGGHGHSHGGHGHSHDAADSGHGHSHGGHGRSHDAADSGNGHTHSAPPVAAEKEQTHSPSPTAAVDPGHGHGHSHTSPSADNHGHNDTPPSPSTTTAGDRQHIDTTLPVSNAHTATPPPPVIDTHEHIHSTVPPAVGGQQHTHTQPPTSGGDIGQGNTPTPSPTAADVLKPASTPTPTPTGDQAQAHTPPPKPAADHVHVDTNTPTPTSTTAGDQEGNAQGKTPIPADPHAHSHQSPSHVADDHKLLHPSTASIEQGNVRSNSEGDSSSQITLDVHGNSPAHSDVSGHSGAGEMGQVNSSNITSELNVQKEVSSKEVSGDGMTTPSPRISTPEHASREPDKSLPTNEPSAEKTVPLNPVESQLKRSVDEVPSQSGDVRPPVPVKRISTGDILGSTLPNLKTKVNEVTASPPHESPSPPENQASPSRPDISKDHTTPPPPPVPLSTVEQMRASMNEKVHQARASDPVSSPSGPHTEKGSDVPDDPAAKDSVSEGSTESMKLSTTPSPVDVDDQVQKTTPVTTAGSGDEYCTRDYCPDEGITSPHDSQASTDGAKQEKKSFEQASQLQEKEPLAPTENTTMAYGNWTDGFRAVLRRMVSALRRVPHLSDLDDASFGLALNISLLAAVIVIHFISYFFSDSNDVVTCDEMVVHDLATKCKYLEELNKAKDMEINRLGAAAGLYQDNAEESAELRKEVYLKEVEMQKLLVMHENLRSEIEEEHRSRQLLENTLASEARRIAEAEENATGLRRRLEDSERAHSFTLDELSSARVALEKLEMDIRGERQTLEETTVDLKRAKDAAEKSNVELQLAYEEIRRLTSEKSAIELENATLSAMIEEIERNRKEGSGGSGGWSDFGDDIVGEADDERDKTPASSAVAVPVVAVAPVADVREAAKLRVQLKKAEQELETVKVALEYERKERERVEFNMASIEEELEHKTKEVEERDKDRSHADERCKELLMMMKENHAKLRDTEQMRDKLRDEIISLKSDLASALDERRRREERIAELEQELKRMRNENLKLETRRFNEVLELKHKLDSLQTAQMKSLAPMTQGYDFSNQLDREVHSPISLWDEAPRPMSSNRTTSPEDDLRFGPSIPPTKKGSTRSRRSDRFPMDNSPSESEKRKERRENSHRRVRSRSHGRQLWNGRSGETSRYMHMDPGPQRSNPRGGFEGEPLDRRHNRSVHVYYSSGGSNGGRSPPPEMPLLSAVPPPGLKKPTGKRAVENTGLDFKSS